MKIVLITSERLQEFPPIISLLKMLEKMGHRTTLLTPYKDAFFDTLGLKNAQNAYMAKTPDARLTRYYTNRIQASMAFHTERLLRRRAVRKIPERYGTFMKEADIVWVLHENTMVLGGKAFADKLGTYLYTMYELCIKNQKVPEIYTYAAQKAALTVVPEYCRAHIAKAYYGLEQVPAIISNKPLEHPRTRYMAISDPQIAAKVDSIRQSGKKMVMYMGILSDERPLEPIIEAVQRTQEYTLAVLGGRTPYLERLEEKMGGQFVYLGEVKPPHHLEVASHADVAYICYVANNHSINAVFCAPNKVYEFAGFGIPMLCNDNPGLKFTVEYAGMGVCAKDLSASSIHAALEEISDNYEKMSQAAVHYYDAEALEESVSGTLHRYLEVTGREADA